MLRYVYQFTWSITNIELEYECHHKGICDLSRSNQISINFLNILISPCDDFTLYSLIFTQIIYLKCDYTINKLLSFAADRWLPTGFILKQNGIVYIFIIIYIICHIQRIFWINWY